MGVAGDAQGKSWEVRGIQVEFVVSPPNTNGESQAVGESPGLGCERVRTGGESDKEGFFGGELLGGILTQLIEQAEDQLRETQECISWYQRAEEKARKQLENLKQLQQLADQETEAE